MKYLFMIMFVALVGVPAFGLLTSQQAISVNKMNPRAKKSSLGTAVLANVELRRSVRGTYDFAVDAGAVSNISLRDREGVVITIPDNAVVYNVFIDTITVPDSAADGSSVGFGVVSVGDVKAAVAEASITGLLNGIPVGTAASSIKLSADKIPFISIALEALTSGKVDVYFDYYIGQ